jgi:SAM-dependent methyltransferase
MTPDPIPPFVFSFYESLPRQGPGDNTITASILAGLPGLPLVPEIMDIGCGTGEQTLVLAARGPVTAIDIHQPFLDILQHKAAASGLLSRISTTARSMDNMLDLPPVDLIWSEGAIYIIGFEYGLKLWRELIRPGGYLVVSELTLLVDNPPELAREYWSNEYPAVQSIDGNCAIIKGCGYKLRDTIPLPAAAWDVYYAPQFERISAWRKRTQPPEVEKFLSDIEREIQIQKQYPQTYGYVFYVMQKPD